MAKGAITLTIVFEGMNLNRDEGVGGNILTLKKLHRGDGKVYTFMSRQALRYCITENLMDMGVFQRDCPLTTKKDVLQYNLEKANIIDYPELDLFGYMYTTDIFTLTRSSPVGLTPAVALETYKYDTSFNANQGLVKRAREQGIPSDPDIRTEENQLALYKYSIVIDIDKVGEDEWFIPLKPNNTRLKNKEKKEDKENILKLEFEKKSGGKTYTEYLYIPANKVELEENEQYLRIKFKISDEEKCKRVVNLVKSLAWLKRQIAGNPSDLKPLLVIGGLVKVKTPIAHNLIKWNGKAFDETALEKALEYIKEKAEQNLLIASLEEGFFGELLDTLNKNKSDNEKWKSSPPKDLEEFARQIGRYLKCKEETSSESGKKT